MSGNSKRKVNGNMHVNSDVFMNSIVKVRGANSDANRNMNVNSDVFCKRACEFNSEADCV